MSTRASFGKLPEVESGTRTRAHRGGRENQVHRVVDLSLQPRQHGKSPTSPPQGGRGNWRHSERLFRRPRAKNQARAWAGLERAREGRPGPVHELLDPAEFSAIEGMRAAPAPARTGPWPSVCVRGPRGPWRLSTQDRRVAADSHRGPAGCVEVHERVPVSGAELHQVKAMDQRGEGFDIVLRGVYLLSSKNASCDKNRQSRDAELPARRARSRIA